MRGRYGVQAWTLALLWGPAFACLPEARCQGLHQKAELQEHPPQLDQNGFDKTKELEDSHARGSNEAWRLPRTVKYFHESVKLNEIESIQTSNMHRHEPIQHGLRDLSRRHFAFIDRLAIHDYLTIGQGAVSLHRLDTARFPCVALETMK